MRSAGSLAYIFGSMIVFITLLFGCTQPASSVPSEAEPPSAAPLSPEPSLEPAPSQPPEASATPPSEPLPTDIEEIQTPEESRPFPPPGSPDLINCLKEALGNEMFNALADNRRVPTVSEKEQIESCLGQFGAPDGGLQPPPLQPQETKYTLEEWREVSTSSQYGGVAAGYAAYGDRIYVFGGMLKGGTASADVRAYDVETNTWTEKALMPGGPGAAHRAVTVGNRIYVIGGFDGQNEESGCTGRVEMYDPAADSWNTGAPMPTPRRVFAMADLGEDIYVIGGWCGTEGPVGRSNYKKVEVYNTRTNSWRAAADAPVGVRSGAAASLEGKIYIVSGQTDGDSELPSVYAYDPTVDQWQRKKDIGIARHKHTVAAMNGKLYVLGGKTGPPGGEIYRKEVEVYDPDSDTWYYDRQLNKARLQYFGALVMDGTMYLLGGTTVSNNQETDAGTVEWTRPVQEEEFAPLDIPEEIESNCIGFLIASPEETGNVRAVGAAWARPHPGPFAWDFIEKTPGEYNFEDTDAYVQEAQKKNVSILPTVWPFAKWDQESKTNCKVSSTDQFYPRDPRKRLGVPPYRCKPVDIDAYGEFLSALVERYDGDGTEDMPGLQVPIRYWEVLNEPEMKSDTLTFFVGDEDDYLEVLKASYETIKEACSDCNVLHGGAAGASPEFLSFWENVFRAGGGNYFDIANIHSISSPDVSDLNVGAFRSLLDRYGIQKPIWVTEAEFRSASGDIKTSARKALEAGAEKIFFVSFAVGGHGPVEPGEYDPAYKEAVALCR